MTQKQALLKALQAAGPTGLLNYQLVAAPCKYGLPQAFRYGARIAELRKDGHTIEEAGGRYTLIESDTLFDAGPQTISAVTGRRAA